MLSTEPLDYSEAEWNLIDAFGLRDFAINSNIMPFNLYREMAIKAVIEEWTGPEVKAVGRALKALSECRVYRLTPEFDKLLKF